jgi:hypothetical protein
MSLSFKSFKDKVMENEVLVLVDEFGQEVYVPIEDYQEVVLQDAENMEFEEGVLFIDSPAGTLIVEP